MSDPLSAPSGPHGRPTAAELVAAVREFLDTDVRSATTGAVEFHARIASNVLAMVERELLESDSPEPTPPPGPTSTHHLDVDSEDDLARQIRAGHLDDRFDDVIDALDGLVRRRLAVAHPGYEEEQ